MAGQVFRRVGNLLGLLDLRDPLDDGLEDHLDDGRVGRLAVHRSLVGAGRIVVGHQIAVVLPLVVDLVDNLRTLAVVVAVVGALQSLVAEHLAVVDRQIWGHLALVAVVVRKVPFRMVSILAVAVWIVSCAPVASNFCFEHQRVNELFGTNWVGALPEHSLGGSQSPYQVYSRDRFG